jgi:alginate O-acetyltransferase complex protein AlgI
MAAIGWPVSFEWTAIVLPVGISFYTFQTMSYVIDVYRNKVGLASDFVSFLCYVTMFPQLVAGPIVRYSVVEQELRERKHTWATFYTGVLFLQSGFAKKVLLADIVAPIANDAFGAGHLGVADAWLGAVAYSFQIYFDFSGYSDIAVGLGLMLGFHFPFNFDAPYRSQSITEFWRRWHMSLSAWLRDYLYISLGGSRCGPIRTYFNLSVTMLLGGLWHGASWNFVAWGGWQGMWLVIERLIGKKPWYGAAPVLVRVLFTFVLVLFGWVLFRAATLHDALHYMGQMVGLGASTGSHVLEVGKLGWTALAIAAVLLCVAPTTQRLVARAHPLWVLSLQPLFLLATLHLHYQHDVPFLYFQF